MSIATNWVDGIGMEVDAEYLNSVGETVNDNTSARTLFGTFEDLPAASASNAGALYFCTNTDKVYRSDGTVWSLVRIGGFSTPTLADPPSTGLTNTALGTAAFTSFAGDRVLTVPSAAGDNLRGEYLNLASPTNFASTAYIEANAFARANLLASGLMLRDNAGKSVLFGPTFNTGAGSLSVSAAKFNSDTAGAGYYNTPANIANLPSWFRIRNDGTSFYLEYSYDGNFNWTQVFSGALGFTPTKIGWGASYSAGGTAKLRLRSLTVIGN